MIKKLFPLCFFLILLISLETGSNFMLPNPKLNRIEAILRILEEDSSLFWRQRPYLNTDFQGVNIITNSLGFRNKEINPKKDNYSYRVICLGASPTFGWGVDFHKTYPFLLEQKLKNSTLSGKIEVVNAGEIGYSTHQGIILLEKYLLKYSPDLITVSYILNDIDRYKFFRNEGLSDKELHLPNPLRIKLNNILSKSRLYLLLKRSIPSLLIKNSKLAASLFKNQFKLSKVRVNADDYRANLIKIINICKANNIKLIFVKIPINLSLPRLPEYESKIIVDNGNRLSGFYYNLGCRYENERCYQKAAESFKKAKDYQAFDCDQDGSIYQLNMEEVAGKHNIPLVDAAEMFIDKGKSQNLFNGPSDPIHPNSAGHKVIADAVFTKIIKYNLLGKRY